MLVHKILVIFTAASFLCYATSGLSTERMSIEFKRYGFADKRVVIAVSQILGAIGLLIGLIMPIAGILASAGFTGQMVYALVVRRRIGDSFVQSLPAVAFLAISIALIAAFAVTATN